MYLDQIHRSHAIKTNRCFIDFNFVSCRFAKRRLKPSSSSSSAQRQYHTNAMSHANTHTQYTWIFSSKRNACARANIDKLYSYTLQRQFSFIFLAIRNEFGRFICGSESDGAHCFVPHYICTNVRTFESPKNQFIHKHIH